VIYCSCANLALFHYNFN